MLAKKSKPGLRFGSFLAIFAILLFGCVSPPATQPIKYSPPTVTEFSASKTTNTSEPTLTSEVIQQPTFTLQPTNTVTLSPTVTITLPPTQTATAVPTLGIGSTQVSAEDGMVQLYVPTGEFLMGTDKTHARYSYFNEWPRHKVYLDAFWIDRTEVTNSMYAKCVAAGKCNPPSKLRYNSSGFYENEWWPKKPLVDKGYYGNEQYANYPVINVTWNDAVAYCQWAGRRLPTEAEWEKAARGTDGRDFDFVPRAFCDIANYSNCKNHTTAVGSYPKGASPYGALDMIGNVDEWVNDWYSASYYAQSPYRNPTGPATGNFHVLRGGSWWDGAWFTERGWFDPKYTYIEGGIRCAVSTAP